MYAVSETAGDRHCCPERVLAPHRGLANIGTVLRRSSDIRDPVIRSQNGAQQLKYLAEPPNRARIPPQTQVSYGLMGLVKKPRGIRTLATPAAPLGPPVEPLRRRQHERDCRLRRRCAALHGHQVMRAGPACRDGRHVLADAAVRLRRCRAEHLSGVIRSSEAWQVCFDPAGKAVDRSGADHRDHRSEGEADQRVVENAIRTR